MLYPPHVSRCERLILYNIPGAMSTILPKIVDILSKTKAMFYHGLNDLFICQFTNNSYHLEPHIFQNQEFLEYTWMSYRMLT